MTALAISVGAVALLVGGFAAGVTRGQDVLRVVAPSVADDLAPQPVTVVEQLSDGYNGALARRVAAVAQDMSGVALETPSLDDATAGALGGLLGTLGNGGEYLDQDDYEAWEARLSGDEPVVGARLVGSVGVIRLTTFASGTADRVAAAAEDLLGRGATALVLDLRGCEGGLVDEGVRVASLFLRGGTVASERADDGVRTLDADAGLHLTDAPLAVLVSNDTRETAEVVTGALQDHRRALVVGDLTAGDGHLCVTRTLSFGGAVRYPVALFETPDDYAIEGAGVAPDLIVGMDKASRDQPEPGEGMPSDGPDDRATSSNDRDGAHASSSRDASSAADVREATVTAPTSLTSAVATLGATDDADVTDAKAAEAPTSGDPAAGQGSDTVADAHADATDAAGAQADDGTRDAQLAAAIAAVRAWVASGSMNVEGLSNEPGPQRSAFAAARDALEAAPSDGQGATAAREEGGQQVTGAATTSADAAQTPTVTDASPDANADAEGDGGSAS
ncbi:hypothetical protein I3I95_10400 [bacterium]|nr:hypothetical protein [bacterium]